MRMRTMQQRKNLYWPFVFIVLASLPLAGCGRSDDAGMRKAAVDAKSEITPIPVEPVSGTPSAADVPQEMVAATTSPTKSMSRTDALIAALTIFVLAIFVGFELIAKVPPTLHTPLMSGSNAISGITLVGAVLLAGNSQSGWAAFFGMLAVIMATINVVGGFMVTDRMLEMFQKN